MSGKRSGLLRPMAGLGVLLLVIVSLTMIPGLRDIGSSSIEGETSRLQRRGDNIEVTSAPFAFPDYMWDIEIREGETADLRPLIPSVATLVPGILTESGIRIHVGEADNAYNLEFQWDTDSSNNPLELTLFDPLQRPVGYWKDISGDAEVILPGGLYKLVLSSEGLLGKDFKITARAASTTEPPKFEPPDIISGIPTLDIQMSEAMFQSWDVQRAAFSAAIKSPTDTVDTAGCKRVLADILTEGGQRTAQLWAAGFGDPVHFSPTTPSFTGRVVSGQLLFGMSRFKLYSIRAMCGFLDYVVSSIMYDEGIFTPRCLLVRVSLNGNSLGLYLLEEMVQSQGSFAGVQRYDGQVSRGGELWTDPPPPAGLERLEPIRAEEERSRGFSSLVNQVTFAKPLAFLSRFQASHATQGRDFRLYRHPYLDSPEPMIRDLNVNLQATTGRLFTETGWWLGWHPIGRGATFNPKLFPPDEPPTWSTTTPYSFFFGEVHPAASQFVSVPENRELFDQYLFYVSDDAFQQRFAARMQSAFAAVRPLLSKDKIPILPGGGQPYREFDSELSWIESQVDTVVADRLITPQTIPVLLERSTLLISVDPPGVAAAPGSRTLFLYNLSPFSARLKLPDYVHIDETSMPAPQGDDAVGWYLSPSLLFPTVVSVDISESQEDQNPYPLTQEAARRFLSLEQLRFSQSDVTQTLVPMVNVQVPDDKFDDFMSWIKSNSIITLGSTYELPAERNLLAGELPADNNEVSGTGLSSQGEFVPDIVILPLSLEQVDTRHRLSLLISNFSPEDISLDLASLRWIDSERDIDVPYSVHAIWKLGERPSRVESPQITLGAAGPGTSSSQSRLGSSMVWTGALRSLLAGPVEEALPSCVLAEFDLEENGTRFMQTDASGLAESAAADDTPVKIIIQEPNEVYIPIEKPLGISRIDGYRNLPDSAALSVSDFQPPYMTGDCLVNGDAYDFWHVENPPETTRHWVKIDFGEPVTLTGLALLPRMDLISQLWDGDNAVFQGSNSPNSEADWVSIAELSVDKARLEAEGWHWLKYTLPNTTAYRYYRLFIDDPSFYSIAELKFQASEWARPAVELAELIEQGILEIIPSADISPHTVRFRDKYAVISGIVKIPPGYVLEIEPGSVLRFTHKAGILSYSPIRAIGTAQQPIILSPAAGSADWAGIAVVKTTGTSEFRHVRMSQATAGGMGDVQFSGGLSFMNTSVVITDTELTDFISEDGLHLHNTSFKITGLTIQSSKSDALDSDWSYGTIADSTFRQSGGDGIDLCGSWAAITNSTMEDCMDKGISIGEGSVVAVSRVRLIRNKTGIAVKDQSIASLMDSEIAENDYGLLRYIKKPIYIYPELTLENNSFRDNKVIIREESPNSWTRRYDG